MRIAVIVGVALGIGCTPFKKSTDAMLARHPAQTRTIPATGTIAPLAVGQWSLYTVKSGVGMANLGEVRLKANEGFERVSVTESEGGQLRVRQWDQNKYQKVFTSVWLPGLKRSLPVRVTVGSRMEQIEIPLARQAWAGWGSCLGGFSGISAAYGCLCGSEGMQSTDRPDGYPVHLRGIGAAVLAKFGNDPSVPRMDVTVPAGTFQQAIQVTFDPPLDIKILSLKGPITLWLHPSVPIDGVVKASIPAGGAVTSLELVDFGNRRAKK